MRQLNPVLATVAAAPLRPLLTATAVAVALGLLAGGHEFGGILPDRQFAPWPLVPALSAALLGTLVDGRALWLERTSARGAWLPRALRVGAGWLVAFVGLVLIRWATGDTFAHAEVAAVGLRSIAMIGGLALIAAVLLPELPALLVPMGYLVLCTVAGAPAIGSDGAPWALPLMPAGDAVAEPVAWALAALGSTLAVLRGGRRHA